MNREERERTKAGWRRPKVKLAKGDRPLAVWDIPGARRCISWHQDSWCCSREEGHEGPHVAMYSQPTRLCPVEPWP